MTGGRRCTVTGRAEAEHDRGAERGTFHAGKREEKVYFAWH
jgi:hypothetical protein